MLRRWRYIGAGCVIGAVAAGLMLLVLPRPYLAEALIAPVRAQTDVQFEPSIKTVGDTPAQAAPSAQRLQALADLALADTIEQEVITQLRGTLPDDQLQAGQLVKQVKAAVLPRSELIAIDVEAQSPTSALAIANAWTNAYVKTVNQVYANSNTLESVQAQRDQAYAALQQAIDANAADLKDNPAPALQRAIQDKEHQLEVLQTQYQAGQFTPPTSAGQSASSAPPPIDGDLARNDYHLAEVRTINDLAQIMRRLDASKESLKTLIDASDQGRPDPTTATALALLQSQLAGLSDALPGQVQFQFPPYQGDASAQLQALAAAIDQARSSVAQELAARRQAYESARQGQIDQLESDLRSLREQATAPVARRQDLQLRQDLAWETYSALARKVEEREVAETSTTHEVEIASAPVQAQPMARSAVLTLLAGAFGGGVLAGLLSLFPHLLPGVGRHEPSRRPQPTAAY